MTNEEAITILEKKLKNLENDFEDFQGAISQKIGNSAVAGDGKFKTLTLGNLDKDFLLYDGTRLSMNYFLAGDGSDGDVTISSPTTLTRDMYYDDLVVSDTLTTGGYKIFVKGVLSGTGTVKVAAGNNGSNGSGKTGGAGGTAAGGYFKSQAGGLGGNGREQATAATAGAIPVTANTVLSTASGGGGDGGAGTGGTKGAGGAATNPTVTKVKFGLYRTPLIYGIDFNTPTADTVVYLKPSSGGSGGGGGGHIDGVGNDPGGGGGGGGASGGLVYIACTDWTGTFTIEAVGGNGGNGAAGTGNNAGGGGGGAGGNGGVAIILYRYKSWTGTYTLTKGNGGTKGASTGTAGVAEDGDNGNDGNYYEFKGNVLNDLM